MRRYFYLVYVACAAACVGFVFDTWAELQEPDEVGLARPRPARAEPGRSAPIARSKAGAAVADRNMFCSSCDGLPPPPPEGELARSALPLDLIATNVTGKADTFATIRHRESLRVGAYREGDSIEGGVLERIRGSYVVVMNTASKRSERIDLIASATTTKQPAKVSSARDELDEGIARLDDTHYEVDRSLIESIIANPRKVKGARISLGKQGVTLYAVRASSPFGKIGLKNGDRILEINGMAATSADKLLEIYAAVKTANAVSVTVQRRGAEHTLHYTIR